MCIAEIGLSRSDFFAYSLYDLFVIIDAYRVKEQKQWYHTRMIAYCNMVASWSHPKKRPPSLERYMPLGDIDKEIDDSFIDERLEVLKKAKEVYLKKVSLKKKNKWQQS